MLHLETSSLRDYFPIIDKNCHFSKILILAILASW